MDKRPLFFRIWPFVYDDLCNIQLSVYRKINVRGSKRDRTSVKNIC